jgi:hypothetical protein
MIKAGESKTDKVIVDSDKDMYSKYEAEKQKKE